MENLTKEEIVIAVLVSLLLLNLFYVFLRNLEKKTTKVKKKPTPKAPATLESLEKRIVALENKNKPKRK